MIAQILSYLQDVNIYSDVDNSNFLDKMVDIEKMDQRDEAVDNRDIIDIYTNMPKLNSLYKPVLLNSKNYPFYIEYYPYFDWNKILKCGEDFLKMIDIHLFNLYQNLLEKNLILKKSKYSYGGGCHDINGELSGIILNADSSNLFMVESLVHEMGHALDNYLWKTQDRHPYKINLEVTSMTLEYLFLYYLFENNLINEKNAKICSRNYVTDRLLRMHNAFIYNKLVIEQIILTITDEPVKSNDLPSNKLKEFSLIQNNLANEYLDEINLYSNYYAVGLLFACIFMEHYKKDSKNTIKEIIDFALLSQNLNTQEILEYFSKTELINATNKNICKVLKKAP